MKFSLIHTIHQIVLHLKVFTLFAYLIMAMPIDKQFKSSSTSSPPSSLSSPPPSSSSIVAHPHWINPCSLPFYALPEDNIPDPLEIYNKVSRRAIATKNCTERVKRGFIETIKDSDFEDGVQEIRQEWLPEISDFLKENIQSVKEEDAFVQAFQYLQYYAVGFEQIILDQILHDGQMLNEFREIEEHLGQLMCELQLGMWYRDISPNKHIGQEAMSQEYRDVGDASRRVIRDFLLLRDFIEITDFVYKMFQVLSKRHIAN